MQIQTIPLAKLKPHPRNVRKTGGASIEDLAANIAAVGLFNPLTVMPVGKDFEVVAGARRLQAMKLLADAGTLPASLADGAPCHVLASGNAVEVSLAENVIRQAMHPADEFEAYQALVAEGQTVDEIADRFGVKPRHVEERLRLANVAPLFLRLYRDGKATLEQLMALALVDDHSAQVAAWGGDGTFEYMRSPHNLRRSLTEKAILSTDPAPLLVGVEAYEAAGGKVRRDLFSDIVIFENGALLNRLAMKKLQAKADELVKAGWGWAEPRIDWPHSERSQFKQVPGSKPSPVLGAIVEIGNNGKPVVHLGLLKPGQKAPTGAKTKTEKRSGPTKNPMSEVHSRLEAMRTGIVRAHLRANPRTAVTVMVAGMATVCFNLRDEVGHAFGALDVFPYAQPDAKQVLALIDSEGVKADAAWRKKVEAGTKKHGNVLAWLLAEPGEVLPLLDFLAVQTVDVEVWDDQQKAATNEAIALVGADIGKHWQLTPEWLQAQGKAYILAALEQALGKAKAEPFGRVKPAGLAAEAHKALAAAGWLPEPMRGPAPKAKPAKGKKK